MVDIIRRHVALSTPPDQVYPTWQIPAYVWALERLVIRDQ